MSSWDPYPQLLSEAQKCTNYKEYKDVFKENYRAPCCNGTGYSTLNDTWNDQQPFQLS